jgi:hypothetical protein
MALQWALRQRHGTEVPAKCLGFRITPRRDSYRVAGSTEIVRSYVDICNPVCGWASVLIRRLVGSDRDCSRLTGHPEVETDGRGGATMISLFLLPSELGVVM